MRPLILSLCLLAYPAANALALDLADVGSYQVLSAQNRPTEKVLRLAGTPAQWRIEVRQPDGSWQEVHGEGDCGLAVSGEGEKKSFFPGEDLSAVLMDCVHNPALAFCSYTLKAVPTERAYLLVERTGPEPGPRRLRREH